MASPNDFYPKLKKKLIINIYICIKKSLPCWILKGFFGRDIFVSVVAVKVLLLHDIAGKSLLITTMQGKVDSYK